MKNFLFALIICSFSISTYAQLNFPFRDTTLEEGQSVNQFCIENNGGLINAMFIDDRFSNVLEIGFDFNFFGNNYSHCLASSNIQLSFDTSYAGEIASYNWSNSNAALNNSIFPALLDLFFASGGGMRYASVGQQGNKKFILEWCGVPKYGFNPACTNDKVSIQVVLHEGTNFIDINTLVLNGSTICPTTNITYKGIQGLRNIDNTASFFTPGRGINDLWGNVGASNNTVRFKPIASGYDIEQNMPFLYEPIFINDSFTNVQWYKSTGGAAIATGPCINIPYDTAVDYYVAKYTGYVSCDSVLRNFNDTVWVHSIVDTPPPNAIKILSTSNANINIYPNPIQSNQSLTVESNSNKIKGIRIVNLLGEVLNTVKVNDLIKYEYALKNYSPGVYVLQIYTENAVFFERILIQ